MKSDTWTEIKFIYMSQWFMVDRRNCQTEEKSIRHPAQLKRNTLQ